MSPVRRIRLAELGIGVVVGTIIGGLLPADAQIIVDPNLPPQLMEGSGVDVVEALRDRREAVEERERTLAEQERALALQREELEASLSVFESEGSGEPLAEEPEEVEAIVEVAAVEPPPAVVDEREPVDEAALEAERLARLDTLARRVQAMNPAAAAAMVTELDPTLAVEVLASISPRDSGKIMDRLDPGVAAALGERMAGHEEDDQ